MKMHMKAIDLMPFFEEDFRVSKGLKAKILAKYSIDDKKMEVIKEALVKNNWKII